MKTSRWKIFPYLFVLILSSCTSCNEPIDPTVLPAETQSGKNSFGCYAGNMIFVNPYRNYSWLTADYGKDSINQQPYVSIEAKGLGGKSISFYFKANELNKKLNIEYVKYIYFSDTVRLYDNSYTYNMNEYSGKNIPAITLTRLDTINHVVSGKFDFELKNTEDSTKIIKFTQGRFDLYLSVIK
jgi:hypothetical protein